jgi:hypothetical protein
MQAAYIMQHLQGMEYSLERIANALDPAVGGAAEVAVVSVPVASQEAGPPICVCLAPDLYCEVHEG